MAEFRVFQYLTAPKADLYRAIVGALMDAKSTFKLHIRPQELVDVVSGHVGSVTVEELDGALQQLCEWGNIESHPDTADASTVEEFLRPRFLYQLSRAGEAAEASVRHFETLLARAAQLQTAALADVQALLGELVRLAEAESPDESKIYLTLRNIWTRFGELTSEAQSFLGALQRAIDLRGTDLVGLITYKERLIDYLERFIRDLVTVGSDIADHLRRLDPAAVQGLLQVAARRDLTDMLDVSDEDKRLAEQQWLQRWYGLSSWFLGTANGTPLVETLRARARAAIPALLSAIASVNESRLTRTDRVADLRAIARWFAEAENDADAHRLWRAAFGLCATRHLAIDDRTLEACDQHPVAARTSWLDAPAVFVSPRFRSTGRHDRVGTAPTIVDCSEAKMILAQLVKEEAAQVAAARNHLTAFSRVRLSNMPLLDRAEFCLFLDLLGQVLSRKTGLKEPTDVKIELAKREQQFIEQRGENERRRVTDESEAAKITAIGEAERAELDAKSKAVGIKAVEEARVTAERDRMLIYREFPPDRLMALALQEFAGKLNTIQQVTITPDHAAALLKQLGLGLNSMPSEKVV